MILKEYYTLSNGIKIPKIGLGTWQMNNDEAYNSTIIALKLGYRHIDTAYAYENENAVIKAIKDSGIKRDDIFITTKLKAKYKGYNECLKYFNESLINLETDYIDLYLIHAPWPWDNQGLNCDEGNLGAWKCMIDLYNQGKIKAIGVSNFSIDNIKNLYNNTGVMPMVNQIRYFIGNTQNELTNYCQNNNILVEAYSPLATGKLLDDSIINNMAKKYNKTISQICIRYCIEKNTLPLPKSTHEERILENSKIDFSISNDDIKILDSIKKEELYKKYRS